MMHDVTAASAAFYEALSALDGGTAMQTVWAQTDYVTYIGPRCTTIIVGWSAQKRYWSEFNKLFRKRSVRLTSGLIHGSGTLAWEMGVETGEAQLADGSILNIDWIATNVYEKLGGQWLVVSHHAQPRPL
jgi:hypothetical protein